MYLYFRLLPVDAEVVLMYSAEEEQRLREVVEAAPGVLKVDDIMRHPKGGYRVSMDGEGAQEIADYLREQGWVSVI